MSEIDDVRAFHVRFGLLNHERPVHLTRRKLAERANFVLEELCEFAEAAGLRFAAVPIDGQTLTLDGHALSFVFDHGAGDQDLAKQADALVDLVYVALGTAVQLGLPWRDLWDDVHAANMRKVRGPVEKRKHGGPDVAKPPGWVGPRGAEILARSGYDRDEWIQFAGGPVGDAYCVDDYKPREIPA